MSMSRHEVNELFQQMQARSQKVNPTGDLPLTLGLNTLAAKLKQEEGAPSIALRQMGQLTKHYLEELQTKSGRADPAAVFVHYNVAMSLLTRGFDVQQSIKKARNAVREANMEIKSKRLISTPEELERMEQRALKQLDNPARREVPLLA